ncbi:hypothetical protein P691DRAFT_611432, partial [Macrolepiota fuliginosa MF-IS2]
ILSWPEPHSATDVHHFLGLVKFVTHYLPDLAWHTHILYPLTTKVADKCPPTWSKKHNMAFEVIKNLVV